jgi:hypothetical protein
MSYYTPRRGPTIYWGRENGSPIVIEPGTDLVEQLFIFVNSDAERAWIQVRNITIVLHKRDMVIGDKTYRMLAVLDTHPGHYDGEERNGWDALAGLDAGQGFKAWVRFVEAVSTFPYGDGCYVYGQGQGSFAGYLSQQAWNLHLMKVKYGEHHPEQHHTNYYILHAEPELKYQVVHQNHFTKS